MTSDLSKKLKQLKRDYFDLKETRREEKGSLLKVINAFGLVAATQKDMAQEIVGLKEMISPDEVLQKVAECLTETFRKDDFIARWGGDEFVVLIEELTKELAKGKIFAF